MIHLITRNSGREFDGTLIGPIEFTRFPSGESHCSLTSAMVETISNALWVEVTVPLLNDLHLMQLAILKNVLDRHCSDIRLFVGYISGGRQDRETSEGEPVTIKVYTTILNNLDFTKVTIMSPHSDVTAALINKVKVLQPYSWIEHRVRMRTDSGELIGIIAPDIGSAKNTTKIVDYLIKALPDRSIYQIQGLKHRDEKTGKLSSFSVRTSGAEYDHLFIIDDICDGGGTFLGIADAYDAASKRDRDSYSLDLLVTHGFFSKGREMLEDSFDYVDAFFNYDLLNYPNQWIVTPEPKIEKK